MLFYFFVAAGVYLLILVLLFAFQRSLLYLPSRGALEPGDYGVPEMDRVEVRTQDGLRLEAWYHKSDNRKQTILYLHGNGGHIGHRSQKIKHYLKNGYGVLLLSYRGYGSNSGNPTEKNLYKDGRAALDFLKERDISLSETVIYGESLGTGVAIELAQNIKINCLLLEAAFPSMSQVAGHHYFYVPTSILLKDRFESLNKIEKVISPIYFVHGEKDRIVPWKYGNLLYQAAPEPKELLLLPNAGHNDLYEFGASTRIINFIERTNQ